MTPITMSQIRSMLKTGFPIVLVPYEKYNLRFKLSHSPGGEEQKSGQKPEF